MNLYHTQNKRGVTLVELLVVLGIIGLLASISIPLVATMAPTPMRSIETASRELYTLLKGARIYATTYNVKTVVSYAITAPDDTILDVPCPVLDSVALARLMSHEERSRLDVENAFALLNIPFDADVYVPVRNNQGRFTLMHGGTCIISQECSNPVRPWLWQGEGGYLDIRGLTPVLLFDLDSLTLIEPRIPVVTNPLSTQLGYNNDAVPNPFPAHVFLPSGGMPLNASGRQRARLHVGLLPSADADDRLTLENQPRTVTLSLYQAQGRVKIES
jgi:prepilin-type N-terminal cleavage/methylation domain-containing protein